MSRRFYILRTISNKSSSISEKSRWFVHISPFDSFHSFFGTHPRKKCVAERLGDKQKKWANH